MSTKVCSNCKQEFPKTNKYFSHHVKPSGTIVFDAICKPCAAAKKRQKRKDNPEHERELDRKRHERDHEKRIAAIRKYRNEHREELNTANHIWRLENGEAYNARRRQKHAENPEINRQKQREHRAIKPELYSEYDKRKRAKQKNNPDWREKHKARRRVIDTQRRHAPGKFTLQDVNNQYELQQGHCYWCSKPLGKQFHVDHIRPLARGGTHDPNNIAIACKSCNLKKNAKLPYVEWQPPNPLFPDDFSADPKS